MSKEQEALDVLYICAISNDDNEEIDLETRDTACNIAKKYMQEFITNHELELAKLNATIQNKNAVISSLNKRLKDKDIEIGRIKDYLQASNDYASHLQAIVNAHTSHFNANSE